jgi:putative flippase GtrA
VIRSSGVAPSGLPKVMRFGLVGVAATATDFTVFNLGLVLAAPSARLSVIALNTLAFATATFVSYQLNTRFTFAAARGRQALLRYLLVALGGAIVYNGALLAALFVIPARAACCSTSPRPAPSCSPRPGTSSASARSH